VSTPDLERVHLFKAPLVFLIAHLSFTRSQSFTSFLFFRVKFFSDVKEAEDKIKKMQDVMKRKYTCDRSVTVTRLEDLLQDAAVGSPPCCSRTKHFKTLHISREGFTCLHHFSTG